MATPTDRQDSGYYARNGAAPKPAEELSLWDLVDINRPWTLVEGGSYKGYFDWVAPPMRVGAWKVAPFLFLMSFLYALAVGVIYLRSTMSDDEHWTEQLVDVNGSYEAYTSSWYISLAGFIWTMLICINTLVSSPLSYVAWISYTVQSWTGITVRFGCAVLAPWSSTAVLLAEALRYYVLFSASATFLVWNFLLFPGIYFLLPKENEMRQRFVAYVTSFRLIQFHVFNIIYAVTTGALTYPQRQIGTVDFVIGLCFFLAYFAWYYLFLDRIGIHLYPILTPRKSIVVLIWASILGLYYCAFVYWRWVLDPERPQWLIFVQ